ncbi:MAG: universal stress protein [Pikeienuella sp.]
MNFRSIFTVWDGRDEGRAAMDLAIRMARDVDGHLDVLCLSPTAPDTLYAADASVQVLMDLATTAKGEAEELKTEALGMTDSGGVIASVRAMPMRYSEVSSVVGREAMFHDLIVLPQPFGGESDDAAELTLDGALFETHTPVLVCPPKAVEDFGRRIMVAWNGDQEAMRAIRAALPLMKKADQVEIVMVEPQRSGQAGTPSFGLMTMLTRHGVNALLSPISRTSERISETLRQKARDMDADMIVMGAYGHSRFRERLFGGATREMLKDTELPVLMTH